MFAPHIHNKTVTRTWFCQSVRRSRAQRVSHSKLEVYVFLIDIYLLHIKRRIEIIIKYTTSNNKHTFAALQDDFFYY